MTEVLVHVETPLNPTEDVERVSRAVHNLFPNAALVTLKTDDRNAKVEATMRGLEALETLKAILRQEAIRDAARRMLLASLSGSSIVVHLNKQAAFAGKASFCERYDESPLGPITLTITGQNLEELIGWLSPSSRPAKRSGNELPSARYRARD